MKIKIDEQTPDAMQKYYNRPTPETDAAKRRITGMADEWVPRYVSEQLERQRDEWQCEAIRWQSIAPSIAEGRGHADESENDTQAELAAWNLLAEARRERDEAIKKLQWRMNWVETLRRVGKKLRKERDEALADLTFRRELYELQTAQLDDMQKDRDEWKAKYIQQNKDLGCELMDPNGTIWEHAQTLQRKLDEAREAEASEAKWAALYKAERDEAREAVVAGVAKWAELYKAERDRARESRDEWQNEIIGWKNKWDCAAKIAVRAECKRDEMALRWEQANDAMFSERALADRLADAVACLSAETSQGYEHIETAFAAWKEARK